MGRGWCISIDRFQKLCKFMPNLGTDSLNEGARPEDLAARIESILETVHAVISDQLPKTTAIISRTRNKSVTPIFRFPEEVLAEIFTNAIFGQHNPNGPEPPTMKQNLRMIYDRLHQLRRVCSTWNDIIIARGVLWSVVPLILGKDPSPYQLSLQRAGSQLHLAADIELDGSVNSYDLVETDDMGEALYGLLSEYGPRFRTISLVVHENHPEILRGTVDRLLQHGTALSLSQLSMSLRDPICFDSSVDSRTGFPADHWWILPHGSPQQTSFSSLLASLTTFRIHRAYFHWESVSFSSRLLELRVQSVALGYDDEIAPFLHALNSAPELRDLAIIDVRTFAKTDVAVNMKAFPIVTLPQLQCLFIEDLYLNTLELLLPRVASGPQGLKLCLGSKCLKINRRGRSNPIHRLFNFPEANMSDEDNEDSDDRPTNIERLWAGLGSTQVDTLILRPLQDYMGLSRSLLHTLLRVLPDLKTLKMDGWDIFRSDYKPSPRRYILSFDEPMDPEYALSSALENLHLTGLRVHDMGVFREMVTDHPLQQIVIEGLGEVACQNDRGYALEPLEENQSFLNWLRENAPNARLVNSKYCVTERQMTGWKPWY
ncbi:unnamed protein product [Rhizoctonia solani]|uniref:F-box domain-containing protein n=1 Tax=Rhizoctonia solani TaxID=456999 RepID=A0A8H3GY50_9AGAM|nr:unnamed protein product [Rhizoctonia solani]